ncbi:MAG: PIN domain-containing protein [Chloroflexota bacterium]
MTVRVFVDTNVLLYARDASEKTKQPLAKRWLDELWDRRVGRLSHQVLNEYYVTVTRKLRPGLPRDEAQADIRDLGAWRPVPIDHAMVEDAWWLEERFELGYWDALIVAAARAAGCGHLLTEDLQHGRDLDGVVVANPFKSSPGDMARW